MDTKKLRQKILDLAIRGKLVPQDPNDEPASVLLERIRAEKERLINEGKIKRSKKTATDAEIEAPFEIPESWEWVRLEDFVMAITDGDHQPPPQSKTGVPFLVISDVNTGVINFSNARFVSEEYYNNLPAIRRVAKGDILFTVTGSYGITILVDTEQNFCFQRHIGLIKTISCSEWITAVLKSDCVQKYCDKVATGTAQKTVSLGHLRDLVIPVPPLSEQKRIVNEIERWFAVIDVLESNEGDLVKAIDQAKSKILDLAIHGKLVPQDPNDEPAIELLKRINPKFEPCDSALYKFEKPQKWCLCRIESIANIIGGVSYKKEDIQVNGIRILRGGNVQDGRVIIAPDDVFILDSYYNNENEVKNGDIVVVASTGSSTLIGKTGYAINVPEHTQIGAFLRIIRPNQNLSSCFINYIFLTDDYKIYIRNIAKGSNINNIKNNYLSEYIIALPPYQEQLRIVAKIEELFAVLDSIKESLE